MLFNLVLIPIEIFFIFMIIKIRKDITKLHFYSNKSEKFLENIHKFDEKYIEEYNKKYMLPFAYIDLVILIIMSISTFVFEREIYHKVIMGGFFVYFIVIFIFGGLSMLSMSRKMYE
ncbi:hypothetical protein [Senegalia massiliensis]|uniref:Uncharacterized protein n=1 Tax=Senegalia massiliensis TaxID=1720316 RepID=A0A845QTW2_9CLOT|nr:hypothetical protein [Senegalia massiliensis]NBI06277.1 hypothetical protein [Senegalia massiliensis]